MPRLNLDFGQQGQKTMNLPPGRSGPVRRMGTTPPPQQANSAEAVRQAKKRGQQKAAQDMTKGLGQRSGY